jgi:hypothetical protein
MTRAKSKSTTRRAERRDPIFAAIEAHKSELKKFDDFCRYTLETEETEKQASSLCAAFAAKERALLRTVPTTLEGITALLAHYVDCGKNGNDLSDVFMDRKLQRHGQMGHEALAETVLASLRDLVLVAALRPRGWEAAFCSHGGRPQ